MKRRQRKKPTSQRPRTALDATIEALPDFLAFATCAVALIRPAWPGGDLLRTAGLLYFIELPLALLALFAGALRINDRAMTARGKSAFVIVPALALGFLVALTLGGQGLVALALLCASTLYQLLAGKTPGGRAVPGFWITYTEGDDAALSTPGVAMGARAGRRTGRATRSFRVLGGAEQFEATLTIMFWFVIGALMFVVQLPQGAVTPEYAASVNWSGNPIGAMAPAHKALWAGALLFGVRCLGKLDFKPPDPPAADIHDDEVLRDIVRKIDSKKRR